MNDIVFVKTGHHYDSYLDFFKLVELSGFEIVHVSDVDISQHITYLLVPHNGEWNPHIDNQVDKPRNAHLVLWNIERPDGSAGSVGYYGRRQRELIYGRYFDEVWVSDRRLALETKHATRFVVLGSDEGLGEPRRQKDYDFCHMSYETNRRQSIYKHFDEKRTGRNCWPPMRDEILKASKFALNVHQDQHPFQEPLRFALFAAYGLPIVSETIYDSYPWSDEFMIFSGYDGLVGKIRQVLENDYQRWYDFGMRARERMCGKFRFKTMVEQAVLESVDRWR